MYYTFIFSLCFSASSSYGSYGHSFIAFFKVYRLVSVSCSVISLFITPSFSVYVVSSPYLSSSSYGNYSITFFKAYQLVSVSFSLISLYITHLFSVLLVYSTSSSSTPILFTSLNKKNYHPGSYLHNPAS